MAKYTPTKWQDSLFDEEGNRVQKGTALSAANLNKIEQGVATVDGKVEAAQTAISGLPKRSEFDAVTQQLADTGVNVRAFGAKGDGLTDDTVAIKNAIAKVVADGGGTVRFPSGVFLVNEMLEVNSSNVSFVGNGYSSHIKSTRDVPIFFAVGYDDLSWQHLKMTGLRTGDDQVGYGHGIIVGYANRILVSDCHFENFLGKGVFYTGFHSVDGLPNNLPQGVHDSWIINNTMHYCADGAMVYNDGQRVEVSGNKISKCTNIGIYIDDSHRFDGTETPRETTEINVINNYINDHIGTSAINLAGTKYSVVRGNYIHNVGQSTSPVKNVNGISVQTVQNHITSEFNLVEGNTIVGSSNIAIDLIGTSNNVIRGNTMINNSLNRNSGSAPSIKLQKNIIKDVLFGSNENLIENNISLVNLPNSSLAVHVHIVDTDCKNNILRYNKFDGGSASYSTIDAGVGTKRTNNYYRGELTDDGFEDGSYKNPSIKFKADLGTGFCRIAPGQVAYVTNGKPVVRFMDGHVMVHDGVGLQAGIESGMRIGTSPQQKIGFWGTPPVARPTGLPTLATDLESVIALVNFMRTEMLRMGLFYN